MSEETPTPESQKATEPLRGDDSSSRRIGNYHLLQKIGEGGMGEVWEADQERPIRRRVAVKIIKRGLDSERVVARFEAERQALAMMNHPNVAKVFDAGTTPNGRPYFAMERVEGEPITQHCDRQRLTTRERLELFQQVCAGVQHAHQKGIIHRDIKPSNVLVQVNDAGRVPKIIDFGVAKATQQRLTERTLFTELGALIGTPEYMSPEQAEMTAEDIDTRTDVYSLGVLLYELLIGTLPFDSAELRSAGFDEIRRRIREEEPSKPSTRISTLGDAAEVPAKNRRTDPSSLRRHIRGDLDWITMRALEKNRARRYGSPSDLAEDIGRHLRDEPVVARPPSTIYQVQKFVRRHRIAVATVALVVVTSVLGVTGLLMGLLQARKAEETARQEAAAAEQVSDFLVELFKEADPVEAQGDGLTVRELLGEGVARIDSLREQPLVQARLMQTMGTVYLSLGDYEGSRALLEEALAIRERLLGSEHIDLAETLLQLGRLASTREDAAANPGALWERALAIQEKSADPQPTVLAWTLNGLANLARVRGDVENANALYERAIAIAEECSDRRPLAGMLNDLGLLRGRTGDVEGALQLHRRALTIREDFLGPEHPDVAMSLVNIAIRTDAVEEKRSLLLRAQAIYEEKYGPDHPNVAYALLHLARLHRDLGEFDAATPLYARAAALLGKMWGADHHNMESLFWEIGLSHLGGEDIAAADQAFQRSLAVKLQHDGDDIAGYTYDVACYKALVGDREQAISALRRAIELGYSSEHIIDDADLKSLHGDPRFEAIVAEVRERVPDSTH